MRGQHSIRPIKQNIHCSNYIKPTNQRKTLDQPQLIQHNISLQCCLIIEVQRFPIHEPPKKTLTLLELEYWFWFAKHDGGNLLKSSGMFADQLEERVTEKLGALSQLKDIEKELTACKMEIHNAKRLKIQLQKILPLSQSSWCTSWTMPEQGNDVPTTATWLADSVAFLSYLQDVHKFKRLLKDHTKSEVVNNRPLRYSELLSKVKCIVATTDAFLKWKAGQTKGMIGRTVAKVAARSEGVLLDEVEALDMLPAVAALNEHFRTCIFVGNENQKFQRRGAWSPRPVCIGNRHSAWRGLSGPFPV